MKNRGFTGVEILIALAIIASLSGGVAYVFKDEIAAKFRKAPKEEA